MAFIVYSQLGTIFKLHMKLYDGKSLSLETYLLVLEAGPLTPIIFFFPFCM